MQLIDSKGNVVKTWTSGDGTQKFTDLIAGETYTIHQPAIPRNYEQQPGGDVTFKIEKNGDITMVSKTGGYIGGCIRVYNAPKGTNWNKVDTAGGSQTQQPAARDSVKTGDNTPILGWLLAMLMMFSRRTL